MKMFQKIEGNYLQINKRKILSINFHQENQKISKNVRNYQEISGLNFSGNN